MTGFEFVLLGLLKAAFAGAMAGAVMALVCLNWDRILSWFQTRMRLKMENPDALGFSMQEKMSNGSYQTVYGIINPRTQQVIDCEVVRSDRVDKPIADMHRNDEMVIFS